jgi:hypothetical protein
LTRSALVIEALLLAGLAEHERARIRRVGQEIVHRSIARSRPSDPAWSDRAPRQLLPLVDQFHHDLACRTLPAPEREHALDRVPGLLIGAEHDPVVFVAV